MTMSMFRRKRTHHGRSLVSACLGLAMVPLLTLLATSPLHAAEPTSLEQDLSQIFVGRSFTLRNFYRGNRLRYGSDGDLLGKKEPGYWSRDGMVKISSVKLSAEGEIVFKGERYCVLFDPTDGQFSNVKTGDKAEVSVQLPPGKTSLENATQILYRVFLTGGDNLPDLVPPYWRDCLNRKVDRPDKNSPWECVAHDRSLVPDFRGKRIVWDVPPRDRSLHNGMQLYAVSHKVQYLAEDKVTPPGIVLAPDPLFQWEQRRTVLDAMVLVVAFTVGEDGRAKNFSIVSPVGMGLDDDAVQALTEWKFKPATRDEKPCAVQARVVFEINAPNTRPIPR